PFLPAIRAISLTTRRYCKRLAAKGRAGEVRYISLGASRRFLPPAPRSLGDREIATRFVAKTPGLFVARLPDASTYGQPGDVVTSDGCLLPDLSYVYPADVVYRRRK